PSVSWPLRMLRSPAACKDAALPAIVDRQTQTKPATRRPPVVMLLQMDVPGVAPPRDAGPGSGAIGRFAVAGDIQALALGFLVHTQATEQHLGQQQDGRRDHGAPG